MISDLNGELLNCDFFCSKNDTAYVFLSYFYGRNDYTSIRTHTFHSLLIDSSFMRLRWLLLVGIDLSVFTMHESLHRFLVQSCSMREGVWSVYVFFNS